MQDAPDLRRTLAAILEYDRVAARKRPRGLRLDVDLLQDVAAQDAASSAVDLAFARDTIAINGPSHTAYQRFSEPAAAAWLRNVVRGWELSHTRDVVVTVPRGIWADWIAEGDAAGDAAGASPTGNEWGYTVGGARPPCGPGDRVYIVARDRLRGYAPLTRLLTDGSRYMLCRQAGAVAVTIPEEIRGFRGWRLRWWSAMDEVPFPDWRTA